MKRIRSLQGHIEMIHRAASPKGRQLAGLYVIEGTRLVERALRAGARLDSVLLAESVAVSPETHSRVLIADLRAAGCDIVMAPDKMLVELTEGRDPGLIIGLVQVPEPVTLGQLLSTPTSAEVTTRPRSPLLLAAIDIVDPGNVGALTRTAHAAGAKALLVAGASDPFHPRATRISRGSIFRLPTIAFASAIDLLGELATLRLTTVATTATGGTCLPDMAWPNGPIAVLMGNEATGLPPSIATAVDYRVTIPMAEGVDSYSVNAAAAIVLYAAGLAQSRHWSKA